MRISNARPAHPRTAIQKRRRKERRSAAAMHRSAAGCRIRAADLDGGTGSIWPDVEIENFGGDRDRATCIRNVERRLQNSSAPEASLILAILLPGAAFRPESSHGAICNRPGVPFRAPSASPPVPISEGERLVSACPARYERSWHRRQFDCGSQARNGSG